MTAISVQHQHQQQRRAKVVSQTRLLVIAAIAIITSDHAAVAQGQFDKLLSRLPVSTNALMVIDVESVHRSALAVKEGWKDRHETAYVNQPLILPPESRRLVLAAQMNPNHDFAQTWEGAVVELTEDISMRSIARAEGGYVDQIAGRPAAWTPSDAYFVEFDSKTVGIMHPAHRQAVARWAEYADRNRTVSLSPYLKRAAASVDARTQIVLAMDLDNVVQPHRLQERLRESEFTRDDPAKQQQWFQLIKGIQGVGLSVDIGTSARATLQVDFSASTAPLGRDAKAVLLSVLEQHGIAVSEMRDWSASVSGTSLKLSGVLTASGMRRLFSLLELPTAKFSSLKDESYVVSNEDDVIAKASQGYFKSVSTLLNDLHNEMATNRDARRNMSAVYLERYGRRIDRLPILNVDEELLAYGAAVSETLRGVSSSSRMAGVRSGVRKSSVYGNYQYEYDGNGYYTSRDNANVKYQIQTEERAEARAVQFKSFKEIEDETAAIRVQMTRKYKVEF